MKKQLVKFTMTVAASVVLAQAAFAADSPPASVGYEVIGDNSEQALLARAFDGVELSSAEILDLPTMHDTRGELWPYIFGVAGLDLALASYFWGVYVPTVTGGGGCVTCSYNLSVAQH